MGRAIWAHVAVIMRYLKVKRPEVVYVPYPAVFVLALMSLLPKVLRPGRLIADAFISVYDTVVNDRKLLNSQSALARLLKSIEKRGYDAADLLVVDTDENAGFLQKLFDLPNAKMAVVPLSTDENAFRRAAYHPSNGLCRVFFFGTLVPLHGVDTIVKAAQILISRTDIRFKLIGDGQTAPAAARLVADAGVGVEWEKGWQTSAQLAREIERADVCLGIFGGGDKAQRVCPFKVYAYAAVGRPIVTADTRWMRHACSGLPYEPFVRVPVGDPSALADAIARLADHPEQRMTYAENSRRFYEARLSNRIALQRMRELLA